MACCGNNMGRRALLPGVTPSKRTSDPISFEYQGATPLTIFGRVTGIRYHFAGPGARTRVDFRDAPILEVMRGFKIVDAATAKSL